MLFKSLFFSIAIFSTLTMFSQTDNGKSTYMKMIKLNDHVYMVQGDGGNIGLSFGKDGTFMVDDQYAKGIKQLSKEIGKKSKDSIRYLINTHVHEDHIGANAAIAKSGAIIFAHENVRVRLEEAMRTGIKKIPRETLPTITFSEDLNFYVNGENIHVFHVPNAHTDGDAMVYFSKSNVLQTGDVFFNGNYPFIDLKLGGSVMGCIQAIQKAISIINEDTKIIPGHGNVATYQDLKNAEDMLANTYKLVSVQYRKNKTEDEVAKMTDITKIYDDRGFGKGFITREAFLRTMYKQVAIDRKPADEKAEKNEEKRKKIEQMKKERAEKIKQSKEN